jgi:hypothetical protein
MPALTYERKNREAYFVVDYLKQNPAAVVRVSWRRDIGRGTTVAVGDVIGTLFWSDGTQEDLKAPGGCNGTIDAKNRRIKYALLTRHPAQWALRLKAAAT